MDIPHGLGYWTADEAAECLPISHELSRRLWQLLEVAAQGNMKPRGGDGSDGTTEEPIVSDEYDDNMEAIWPLLSEAEQTEIAQAYNKERGE